MQDADLFEFMAIFRELLGVFPKRLDEAEIGSLSKAYFHALRRFTIPQLRAGADVWVQRGKFFPKPSEWRESVPREAVQSVALVELTPVEAAEHLDAERLCYQGEPCACRRCQGAGVTHRFLRYVPESDEYGRDAKALIGERVVTRGHWAHGEELAGWYAAKDRFRADYLALLARMSMPKLTTPIAQPEPEPEPEPEELQEAS